VAADQERRISRVLREAVPERARGQDLREGIVLSEDLSVNGPDAGGIGSARRPASPRVAILILNWKKWNVTLECLESVLQNSYPDYEIVVVDNGSGNGSIEKVISFCEGRIEVQSPFFTYSKGTKPVPYRLLRVGDNDEVTIEREGGAFGDGRGALTILASPINLGFAGGNNLGIRYLLKHRDPAYVMFMNNDVVVDREYMVRLVEELDRPGRTGLVAPKILYYEHRGASNIINCAGCFLDLRKCRTTRRGRGEVDSGQYNEAIDVDFVDGACFLMSRAALEAVGGFDSSFFTYWEETDLCFRAGQEGFSCRFVPGSVIWHHESYSTIPENKEYYMVRNRYLFIRKNGTDTDYLRFLWYHLVVLVAPTFIIYLCNGEPDRLGPYVRGTVDGIRMTLRKRRAAPSGYGPP